MSLLRRRMMMASKTGASEETEGLSDYFHVISHEDQTIAFLVDCQYNLDDGNGWIDLNFDTEINLPKDSIIYVSALADKYSNVRLEYAENISLAGNIMSLVYGHDFKDKYSLEGFDNIFAGFANSEINSLAIKSIDKLLLPATTLSYGCYSYMFYGCENITKAPVLPAPVLEEFCYLNMFQSCKKLNYIKMLATDISANYCLSEWVDGVSSTGTFVKHPDMTSLPTGVNGIPEGWTVVNDGEESGGLINFTIDGTSYQAEEGMTWEEWVNSSYNTDGFIIDCAGLIKIGAYFIGTEEDYVSHSDIILEDYQYLLVG